jgi:hypothetical protein
MDPNQTKVTLTPPHPIPQQLRGCSGCLRRSRCSHASHSVCLALLRLVIEDAIAQEEIARVQLSPVFGVDEVCAELGFVAVMAKLYWIKKEVSDQRKPARELSVQKRLTFHSWRPSRSIDRAIVSTSSAVTIEESVRIAIDPAVVGHRSVRCSLVEPLSSL